jgi:hypothetical protein
MTHAPLMLLLPLVLAAPAPAQGLLKSLDGTTQVPQLGTALVRFHDINGDGWRDFLAGAPGVSDISSPKGHVVLISGRFLHQGTPPAVLSSFQGPTQDYGVAVVGLEDINNDGVRDFAAGAPSFVAGTGFGFPDGAVRITDTNGTLLGQIAGAVNYEALGSSLAVVGDVNGDGFKDILAGSPNFTGGIPSVPGCGKAAIYSGKSLLQSLSVVLRAHLGDQTGEHFGTALATGYFNADAVVDYAIGTPWRTSTGGVAESGRVSIYSGATGALMRTIHGSGGSHFGAALAAGLDVTGDGVHDLIIGAPHAATNGAECGSAYVYSGAALDDGGLLLPARAWHGPIAGAHFGAAVALVHDLNADGDADVIVGAPDYEFFPFGNDNGQFRVYSGETGELLGYRSGLDNEHLGGSFVSADIWDGKVGWEFLVGSPASDVSGADTGRVSSYSIFPNTPTTYCTAQTNSKGCTPAIAGLGQPSVVPGTHFTVKATNVLNNVPGLLIYSYDAAASPFQGGIVCVSAPLKRTGGSSSNGTPPPAVDCTGTLWFDFNAYIQSGADASLVAGQEVFCQFWSRDPASASGSNLTNGLRFLIHP